jgi:hypothetical protein
MPLKPKKGEFYRHFKGSVYQVLGYALHSETKEEMIIYKSFKDEINLGTATFYVYRYSPGTWCEAF